jgi:hypothetical protein
VAQSEHAATHEAWATTTATLRMFIDICLHKLQPPTGGAANLWIIASSGAYLWLLFQHACVRTYVWHTGYRLIRNLLEATIQSTPVGAGIYMLANTATYVMATTRALSLFWITTDPPSTTNSRATRRNRSKAHSRARKKYYRSIRTAIALSSVFWSLQASATAINDHTYDSDSFLIAIDNCSSRCITNSLQDFIGQPTKVQVKVSGIGGAVMATYKGTVKWAIEDDNGRVHTWLIPDTYYNESTPYRLLSPQHWAHTQRDGRGTWAATYHDAVNLFWKSNRFRRAIPLSPGSNIALLRSAPGFQQFSNFCAHFDPGDNDPLHEQHLYCMPTTIVSDDEHTDDEGAAEEDDDQSLSAPAQRRHPDLPDEVFNHRPATDAFQDRLTVAFDNGQDISRQQLARLVEDDEAQYANPTAELLAWHYRLGHLPFGRIKKLAERGDLPTYLKDARVPRCASCLFGKAHRRPWRTKAPPNQYTVPPPTAPGAVVGVDQLISATPGLVGQMRGTLTKQRYTVSTVFVDHFSGLSYVHPQLSTATEHTLEAKRAFERFAKAHGVLVRHYHADNHIFDSKLFVQEVHRVGQTISYCAVNAHHQNGRAEKKIRDLQELARTMILHARQRWPSAITTNLWPYALRMANEVSNITPILIGRDHVSPLELFSQVEVRPQVKFAHTFGSPVYVLDEKLQAGQSKPKWEHRARIGVYLGPSPRHSRKVALVLNLQTGHISPQFHVQHDDLYDTMRANAGNPLPVSRCRGGRSVLDWRHEPTSQQPRREQPSRRSRDKI